MGFALGLGMQRGLHDLFDFLGRDRRFGTASRADLAEQRSVANRLREPFEAVADHHAHIGGAAVFDLGEHGQPELGALTALAGPQPEDVALTSTRHAHGHTDRPVGDLTVADLDEDRFDEHHRIPPAPAAGCTTRPSHRPPCR